MMIVPDHVPGYCRKHNSPEQDHSNYFYNPHPQGLYRVFDFAVNRFLSG